MLEGEADNRVKQPGFLAALADVDGGLSCKVEPGTEGTDEEGLLMLRTEGLDEANLGPSELEQLLRLLTTTFPDSAMSTTGAWLLKPGGSRELDG